MPRPLLCGIPIDTSTTSTFTSWLLDLTATALVQDPNLPEFAGRVSDSGEGRWTINATVDEGLPVPVLFAALYQGFSSRQRGLSGQAAFRNAIPVWRPR
jgi:6-phosphogluconate dehydrogenase (decarboxylating)